MPSGTYQSDDDAASSSSAGSTSQVSYKESLVRRKSGGRKAGSSRSAPNSNASSDLGVQYAADEPITTEESWDITPTLRAGLQRRTFSSVRSSSTEPKLLSSTGTTEMSYTSDFQEQSSGYSSSEEGFYRPTLTAWYWYPSILGLFSRGAARRPGPLRSTTDTGVLQGEATGAPMLPVLREEIRSQLEERESRWMEEREKAKQESHREWERMQTLRSELQQLKLSVKNFETEHRSFLGQELAGMEKNIADLQAGISSLHISTDLLRQQVESQQTMNAEMKGELSKWIVSYLSSGAQGTDLVLQPELQQALGDLERRLLQKLAEEREKEQPDMWRSVGETLQREGAGAVTVEDIQQIVHRALRLFHADGIGMADYALESSGGSVINTRCSKTYTTRTTCISLFGIPLWYQSESPRTVIQPDVYPGKCWAFQGSEGFLVISLSYPIQITHVTLEHLPKVLSPTGHIDSAPRDFSVYGMSADKEDTEEGALLGTFTYDQDGEPVQTFRLSDNDSTQQVYQKVELRILSNWGHLEFTCIYRFRVHGKRWVG
ncbi:SUN domain-containing protein 2-like [Scleropages formosus]|uniref:SUN domain-containing protein 2-like n=1 Tax=Scleropages formosus TaxID=113540 RepID=A0A0P7TFP1_SCLFO|nr:SUN domain-containing protein 2-like [Scleropages formosus]